MTTDRDAQPDRPFAHAGGAQPVPRRAKSVFVVEVPDDAERLVGKRAIEQIKKSLRQESA